MTICTHQEDEDHDDCREWFFLTSNLSIFRLFSTNQYHSRKFGKNQQTAYLINNQQLTFILQYKKSIFKVFFSQKHCF